MCISLISVCYSMQEETTCLGNMEVLSLSKVKNQKKRFLKSIPSLQACLLEDKVDNSYCHQQLQVCLQEEEDGEHYREVLREEEHWAKVVRLLLAKEH